MSGIDPEHAGHGGSACPVCGTSAQLPPDAQLGEVIYCVYCGVELEIVSIDPVWLELYEEEEK